MLAVRMRSWRMLSDLAFEKKPINVSQPVFERMASKSFENVAVTSSRPMISSAMLAPISSV